MSEHTVFVRLADWTRIYEVSADTPNEALSMALRRFWSENPAYRGRVHAEIAL